MKIILRENVENLGRRGDVVNVAPGYGRNFLMPNKLAYPDTPGSRKLIAAERRAKEARENRERHEAEALAQRITGMTLTVRKKVGEEGHLYGSVTTQEISDLLAAHGIEVDRRRIALAEPIRTVGSHTVPVKLHREVVAQVGIEVAAEAEEE